MPGSANEKSIGLENNTMHVVFAFNLKSISQPKKGTAKFGLAYIWFGIFGLGCGDVTGFAAL